MTDFLLLEQLHKTIKEIPKPRLMFRKGISAGGFFRPYMSLSEYTRATVFKSLDEITPVTVRFSAMLGDRGTADTIRNIKGMDVKFRAEEKDYDMLCRSLPVCFIGDKEKLPAMMEAFSLYENFDGRNPEKFWRFVIDNPETINCVLRFFSRCGISDSFVDTIWYSVNDTIWQNARKQNVLVRYRWVPIWDGEEIHRNIDRNSAEFMAGYDPDRGINELKRRIARREFPSYELQLQMWCNVEGTMNDKNIESSRKTLIWDEEKHPYMAVGIMKLTQIPENYLRDCDLLSFAPSNTIDGIDICHDDFTSVMDFLYKIEAAERGSAL